MATAKASSAPVTPKAQAPLPAAIGIVGKIRSYSWGALLGLGAAGAFSLGLPSVQDKPWLELPLALLCVAAGMLVERVVNYFVGRQVDSWLQHRAARFEAALELSKLAQYRAQGTLNEWDARRLAAQASKRDILAGRQPGPRRGPYRRKPRSDPATMAQPPAATFPAEATPEPKRRAGA